MFIELFDEVLIDMIVVRLVLIRTFSSYLSSPELLMIIGNCFKRSDLTDFVNWTGHVYVDVLWTELFTVDCWMGLTLYILTLGLYVRGPQDHPLASQTPGWTDIGQGQGLRHLFIVV